MRSGRPKQHEHNWQNGAYFKRVLGWDWGRPDFWGFEKVSYLKCVRGGKVKHILALRPPNWPINPMGNFITASGIMPEGWVDEEFARRTGRK
jgi:hypothetical protein